MRDVRETISQLIHYRDALMSYTGSEEYLFLESMDKVRILEDHMRVCDELRNYVVEVKYINL